MALSIKDRNVHAARSQAEQGVWWRWTVATTLGELIGFSAPTLMGTVKIALEIPDLLFVPLITLAGLVEGGILAFFQWQVLRRFLPAGRRNQWILNTALAAGLIYILAMLPNSVGDLSRFNLALLIGAGLVFGLVALLAMGVAQWLVLRFYFRRAAWWILFTAAAWPLGVAVPVTALTLVPDNSPLAVFIAAGISGGVLMGVVVGALTGAGLAWLLRKNKIHTII